MNWTPPVHVLLCPIEVPADPKDPSSQPQEITEIVYRPFTYAAYKAALRGIEDEDDEAKFEALGKLATGLTVEALDLLKRPDYVTIAKWVHEFVTKTSAHYLGKPADPDNAPLLIPLEVDGHARDVLPLTMPALKATKVMKKLPTADDRAVWITAHCTGLMVDAVKGLSVPDWNMLQERINDFLNQPAAYFQSATSK